ncbi:pentapeptide repeat-containing protein [Streptomyces canus]|uniref:pentapeptide repeat-containing protein n=1 Tax=Streptomyces canus TaxID=58343 RepID=UPI0030DFED49
MAVSLPGLAALAALLFTWAQVGQASKELRISEQGQITNRFTAAINNLGSDAIDVRLGGIFALQRIMQDSARDHPTVVSIVAAYVRQHAPLKVPTNGKTETTGNPTLKLPSADIQAALNVLSRRPENRSEPAVELYLTDLRGIALPVIPNESTSGGGGKKSSINFRRAVFTGSDLSYAVLDRWDLGNATIEGVTLSNASLSKANLRRTNFDSADLTDASICDPLYEVNLEKIDEFACPDLTDASFVEAKLIDADLTGANLSYSVLCFLASCANLNGTILDHANLKDQYLQGASLKSASLLKADLTNADLRKADLRGADLTGAKLTGAKLDGAKLDGATGLQRG